MLKVLILALLLAFALSRSYPLFKQCDSRWGNDQLGTSGDTVCHAGCLMSSASMALAGTGHGWNPGSLNAWLRDNGGYYDGGMYLWASINSLGISFEGKVSNGLIKSKLDQGKVVICNVRGGGHWVLAYAYDGDTIYVNDSGFSTNYYPMSQIVDGQNGIYGVYGSSYYNILNKLKNIRSNEDLDKMAD